MEGILLVDKPLEWTSFDVVNYIRKIIAHNLKIKPSNIKVGHAGTLDPLASGLLIILIGSNYTKKSAEFLKLDKKYITKMKLGIVSKSYDLATETELISHIIPSERSITEMIMKIQDTIFQVPPNYSAIKINGKRSYKLAREGKDFELLKRPIKIHSITKIKYKYPFLEFEIIVSSGTYIRSIVNDLGTLLQVGAVMIELKRVSIDKYKLENAITLSKLDINKIKNNLIFI